MHLKILKKDLMRKKTMNVILFIFIVLCTTFAASSLSNIVITRNAISYFGEVTNVSDYIFVTSDGKKVEQWLETRDEFSGYSSEKGLVATADSITVNGEDIKASATVFLTTVPTHYNLVLSSDDKVMMPLDKGELAMPYNDANNNGLKIGDVITVKNENVARELKLAYITKDMIYGSPYMSVTRLMLSEADYQALNDVENPTAFQMFSVKTDKPVSFERDLLDQSFALYTNFDKTMLENIYTMDLVIAAILMVVSLILIIIAFVILRFTIVFTIQEDYREIGVMKAIGLKNRDVRGLYLAKYLFLAVIGSLIGVFTSLPFGSILLQGLRNNMALQSASTKYSTSPSPLI